jgi:hypothetical protein
VDIKYASARGKSMGEAVEFNNIGTAIPRLLFHSLSPKMTLAIELELVSEKINKRIRDTFTKLYDFFARKKLNKELDEDFLIDVKCEYIFMK